MYRTEKVKLTPLYRRDIATLFRWINDRELVQYNAPYKPIDYKTHQEWYEDIRKKKDVSIFAIRTARDDKLIGSCQLH